MNKATLWILSTSFALVSCGPRVAGEGAPPTGLLAEDVHYTTQVTVGQCVMDTKGEAALLAGIATALIGAAVTEGVNRVGAILEESAKPDTQTAMASRKIEVNKDGFGPCVQIARGWYHEARPDAGAAASWAEGSFLSGGLHRTLWRNGLWLADAPDFYFEGRFLPSGDNSQLTIEPLYTLLDDPIASRMLRPGGVREVVVSFAFSPPGQKVDLRTAPGTALVIGTLEPGIPRNYPTGDLVVTRLDPTPGASAASPVSATPSGNPAAAPADSTGAVPSNRGRNDSDGDFGTQPGGFSSGPSSSPGMTITPIRTGEQAESNVAIIRSPWESDWFSLALGDSRKPMTVTGLVTEVQGKSEFLSFVAAVFKEAKPAITTGLQTALDPAKREEARENAMSEQETLATKWTTAFSAAYAKLDSCAAGGGNIVQLAVEARNAMMSFNQASRAFGQSEPFSRYGSEINPAASDTVIRNACTTARDKIRPQQG